MADTDTDPTGKDANPSEGVDGGEPPELDVDALFAGLDEEGEPPELDVDAIAAEMDAGEPTAREYATRALSRLQGKYPPAVLASFEEDLLCFLLTHPAASAMLARIRPRSDRSTSGSTNVGNATSERGADVPKGQAG
jgi:hypothetical protein